MLFCSVIMILWFAGDLVCGFDFIGCFFDCVLR